ncbi:hypothetical protein [Noviherbaspirillum galbum]|uniref:Uncharacterized protein n=1 Tax=Noviherbaspirillum galbum TaxID=2709383 RepID=A0A6B3SRX4_9BURK|nr:hypothetical protein [Noviherbaspirillum galbum]NEX63680.1 hypothetical protein [Noviherbaspirillum galbum]
MVIPPAPGIHSFARECFLSVHGDFLQRHAIAGPPQRAGIQIKFQEQSTSENLSLRQSCNDCESGAGRKI